MENLEEFVDIEGYKGLYKINRNGDIFSIKYNKILKPRLNKSGYYCLSLNKNYEKKGFLIHRLIALHFIPNPDNLPLIDHIDRNRTNNSIENLRWATHSDNCRNVEIKGCISKYIDKRKKPENNTYFMVYVRKKFLKQFKTYDEASEYLKKYLEENEINKINI